MYIRVRQFSQFTPITWYRILRQHNHFSVAEAIRYALWLSYGNEAFPPGELSAWADRQIEAHPWAIGITMVVWADALLIFTWWLLTR